MLWGGPAGHILQSSGKSSHRREEVEGLVHNEMNNIASWHIPALSVERPLVTNGAGDALLGERFLTGGATIILFAQFLRRHREGYASREGRDIAAELEVYSVRTAVCA